MSNEILVFNLYLGIRMYLNVEVNKAVRTICLLLRSEAKWIPYCWLCQNHIQRKQVSADHLIPVSLCWKLELPELVVDKRNIKLAHRKCNTKRGDSISLLPEAIKQFIAKKQAMLVY